MGAMTWVRGGIRVAKNLGARVMMTVFFSKCHEYELGVDNCYAVDE